MTMYNDIVLHQPREGSIEAALLAVFTLGYLVEVRPAPAGVSEAGYAGAIFLLRGLGCRPAERPALKQRIGEDHALLVAWFRIVMCDHQYSQQEHGMCHGRAGIPAAAHRYRTSPRCSGDPQWF